MYTHIFTASRLHLVPTIIEGFLKSTNYSNHCFWLVSEKKYNKSQYIKLFKQFDDCQYKFIDSFKDLKKTGRQFKSHQIILHGVPYKWMAYFILNGFKNVKWICWGAGARINKSNWVSVLFTPIKRFLYKRMSKVGVLMPQDAESLKRDFKISKIHLLSYFGTINKFPYTSADIKETNNYSNIKNIYIGNNSSCIGTYLPLIKKLAPFKDHITITCMVNYSFEESSVSKELRNLGNKIYGSNFVMDTKLYPLNDYYQYMNRCDIYICDGMSQTGLGAIYTCLRLGKKLFLNGINYEWIKSLGCKIFRTDEIKNLNKDSFLKEIQYEDKCKNFQIIDSYLNLDRILNDWKIFLD